ncbi:hypothetical protein EK21DRAFT_82777 [Setomelanomma holmii]|uniref:6-methylsalicylic acid synthase n=1 Tax=Setomelanomma holmii TaxID=210430 RepID=A0A9P4GW90_9PLEO|nr:hypothetical protein EK21DRAFT_82777 [Setomelanomma holmii]
MSCRTAGGNDTLDKLWDFLLQKKTASGEVPSQRWEPWRNRDPRNGKILDKIYRKGYFLDNLEGFDAAFFGISPKEAELMDPHQRLGLELTWEALENAGISPQKLRRSDTAVYMGVDSDDYSRMLMEDLPNVEAWSGIGTAYHGIPNRISYHMGLQGPSAAIDAACASSLIAIHLARQAIETCESTVAICGGVNVICAPGLTHMLQKAGALTSEGVCRSFDDGACGYARGEGGAIVVLKRLGAALEDGDNILAVLKSSASAQDGKTNGIMAPNSEAQELVARQALKRAGHISPHTIDYVEAHATSTSLGDPEEIRAIARVYGEGRPKESPCYIGSIKPNVGHLEAAAGAIGFVKAVLSLQKGILAPQASLNKLNTKIDWYTNGLEVVRDQKAWPDREVRRAAVCCYGYGGSVCHAILEQAPKVLSCHEGECTPSSVIIVLSATQEKRLHCHALLMARWLSSAGRTENLGAISRTLLQRRAPRDYRVSLVASSHEEAIRSLTEFAKERTNQWTTSSRILSNATQRRVVWVFSGHGAQWQEMGKELLGLPVFYSTLSALVKTIQEEAGFSVLEALGEGDLGGSAKIQVLTYAVQIGLANLLKSYGVLPQAIIGHSVGEIAAAVVAGCLTGYEGAMIVARRAKLYEQVQGQGAMALTTQSFESAVERIGERNDLVAAIRSSPSTCVVSGTAEAVEEYLMSSQAEGIKSWRIETDIAFHSPMLKALAPALKRSLGRDLNPRHACVPLYSTSAPNARTTELRDIGYWTRNTAEPVRLVEAVEATVDDGFRVYLEISTHPIVSHSIADILTSRALGQHAAFGVMKRDASPRRTILHAISRLHAVGAEIDLDTLLGEGPWSTIVPNSPWFHKPYWKATSMASASIARQHDVDKHTLLGSVIEVASCGTKVWTTTLDDSTKPYPSTHQLDGTEIIPAAVYCNTFRNATAATVISDLELRVPTPMTVDKRELQVELRGDVLGMSSRLMSSDAMGDKDLKHTWIKHATAKYSTIDVAHYQQTHSVPVIRKTMNQLPATFARKYLQKIGVSGIAYPWTVLEHFGDHKQMLVKVDMNPSSQTMSWDASSWAPFLDAATSVGASIFYRSVRMRIVSGIDQIVFLSSDDPPKVGYLRIEDASDGDKVKANIGILSEDGVLLTRIQGMRFSDVQVTNDKRSGLVHCLAWIPLKLSETPLPISNAILVSSSTEGLGHYVKTLKMMIGGTVVSVTSGEQLKAEDKMDILQKQNTVVVYLPDTVDIMGNVAKKAHAFTWEAASILSILANMHQPPKLFVVTDSAYQGESPTSLAQYALYGFARVAASEYPDAWGGLIDNEGSAFPMLSMRYAQEQSVIRVQGGVPRGARLRPFTTHPQRSGPTRTLLPRPHGTYVVTGGFGDLGLEVLEFLVKYGARRIVVVSRRRIPPRKDWSDAPLSTAAIVKKIEKLEKLGATIYAVSLDISSETAVDELKAALDRLSLPPVLGVVHAAGVAGYGYIKDASAESYADVMAPKIQGTLHLHKLFPPDTLDFFVLFSSIGQIIGTPGQSAYAASNAFLDGMAIHRRAQGCNSIAMQWTAWRGLGLASNSAIVDLELHGKGVTAITVEEGFQAWTQLSSIETAQAVIMRTRILDADELLPCDLIADMVQRRTQLATSRTPVAARPKSGPELRAHLNCKVKDCLSRVLFLEVEEIDDRAAIADLGIDSIVTVTLGQQLQKAVGIAVPSTLTWSCPTVEHLVDWLYKQLKHK